MLLAQVVPDSVAAAEAFSDIPFEQPFPGEQDLITTAVERRRREFVTARRCAREALALLGHPPAPIRSGSGREPLWPAGVVGSITHCLGYRAAAVAHDTDLASIGIDAEPHGPLPDGVLDAVTIPPERVLLDRLARADPGTHWGRLLFSAKESIYKAWYPLTGRWLGYEDACLSVDAAKQTFTARLLLDGQRRDGGPRLTGLHGRYRVARGLIVTAVSVSLDSGAEAAYSRRAAGRSASPRAANDFSAALLMPARLVHEAFADNQSTRLLATRLNVSELAMGYRLANLGLR